MVIIRHTLNLSSEYYQTIFIEIPKSQVTYSGQLESSRLPSFVYLLRQMERFEAEPSRLYCKLTNSLIELIAHKSSHEKDLSEWSLHELGWLSSEEKHFSPLPSDIHVSNIEKLPRPLFLC
jgi:hypothetical protein